MSHVPGAHEIETFSGRFVDVSNPSADSIVLEDIAHALANICRYGGHCKRFYSVAEHAVFVSERVRRKGHDVRVQLAALHHDDAEAFLGDIPRPIKPLLGPAYKEMTAKVDDAIISALGLNTLPEGTPGEPTTFHDPYVKAADNWALFVEARHLLPSEGRQWWQGAQSTLTEKWELEAMPSRIVTPDYFLGGIIPDLAESLYLKRHKELIESL